ncbi:MAG: porin [Parvibaculales bacterium]
MSDIFSKTLRRGLAGVSLLALAGGAASAEPVVVSLGGFFTQSIAVVDSDEPAGSNLEDNALNQNAEIHFKGRSRFDNGMEIGFQVQLESETSDDQIDEHYVYVKGDWGKVIVGAENGVAHLGEVTGPSFVAGLKSYNNSLTDEVIETAYDTIFDGDIIEDANMSTKIEHISGDANKVSYFTPKINGVQLGVSFTPNNENRKGGESNFGNIADGQEDIIEYSLSYSDKFDNGSYKIGVTASQGNNVTDVVVLAARDQRNLDADGVALTTGTLVASTIDAVNAGDPESMGFGVIVKYDNWTFGGNQTTYEDLAAVDAGKYALSKEIETNYYGLAYRMGRHKFGIGFTDSDETRYGQAGVEGTYVAAVEEDTTVDPQIDAVAGVAGSEALDAITNPNVEYKEMLIGGTTKLASGVSIGYYYQDTEVTRGSASGDVSLVGVTLALKF